eukprot:4132902-Lingulodinium_polyedra.AAC.1
MHGGPSAGTARDGLPTGLQRAGPPSKGNILKDTTCGRPAPMRASRLMMPCRPRRPTKSVA